MYNESGINPQLIGKYQPDYCGLIMFGSLARKELNISKDSLLSMNHLQQAKLAVRMWQIVESWGSSYKIKDFLSLQLATFSPAWIPYKNSNEFPADSITKAQNKPLQNAEGKITPNSVLYHYRKKAKQEKALSFFVGKI
jgi:hypothetical protein